MHQAEARRDLVRGPEPDPQLLQGDVRPTRRLGGDRRMMRGQLERLPVALRPRLGLARGAAPGQRLWMQETLTWNSSATALAGLPPSIAARNLLRRSVE